MVGVGRPEAPSQGRYIMNKLRLDPKVRIKHVGKDAEAQVPLQRLGQHKVAAGAGQGHVQRQHSPIQHADQVVVLAHDAAHDVMLCQISHNAKACCLLGLQGTERGTPVKDEEERHSHDGIRTGAKIPENHHLTS